MTEQYQYSTINFGVTEADSLDHYRIEIRKLKDYNIQQQLAYQKKIESLQRMLKQQGFGSVQQQNRSYAPSYQTGSALSNQILKRDKQINRLSEQNDRLRKQFNSNPDRELINKRRGYFDEVADKDAEIMRLKKTVYQLQAKYDGKYFNQPRMKNQYEILQKQNEKLRKQLQENYRHNRNNNPQVNNQILEGIRYKKQYDIIIRENEQLKNQLRLKNNQINTYKQQQFGRQSRKSNESARSNGPHIIVSPPEINSSNNKNMETLDNTNSKQGQRKHYIFNRQISNYNNNNNIINNNDMVNNNQQNKVNEPIHMNQLNEQNQQNGQNVNNNTSEINNEQNNQQQKLQSKQSIKSKSSKESPPSSQKNMQNSIEEHQRGFDENGVMLNEEQKKHLKEFQQQPSSSFQLLHDEQQINNRNEQSMAQANQSKTDIPMQMNSGISFQSTEKKRGGYYDHFNIGEVTKNVRRQQGEVSAPISTQSIQLAQ